MPSILYGTAWKQAETARLVEQALRAGFRGIDTACQPKHYDEPGVGAGVAAVLGSGGLQRPQLWLQTKFTPLDCHDPRRVPYDPRATPAQQVEQSFQASLRNLRTSYLDALVLHSPVREPDVWPAMEALVDTGGVRHLGISNCNHLGTLERLWRSARHKPVVVQNRFYRDTNYDRGIRAFCRTNGLVYQSFWTLTANPHLLAAPALTMIASRRTRTPAQILYRWLVQNDVVPLTGTKSPQHMQQDLAIDEFELDAAELAAIEALL
jgi:diketogulonate reductase-like aldo/keto reductase